MKPLSPDPTLPPALVEAVLSRLGLSARPSLDRAGLNTVYAAWCASVPFDNLHKRIWLTGERSTPLTGGDPVQFFENWLAYGTGGTCWPTSEAIYTLLRSLGFSARRIAGYMIETRMSSFPGHGSVIVTIGDVDYLVDASILAFEALPLVPGRPTRSGPTIHAIKAVPTDSGFDVHWHPGHLRDRPVIFRTDPAYDPVDHAFFRDGYDRSIDESPFNAGVCICRRFPDAIISIRHHRRIDVSADGSVRTMEIIDAQRNEMLIEELGIAEQIVQSLPPDEPDTNAS